MNLELEWNCENLIGISSTTIQSISTIINPPNNNSNNNNKLDLKTFGYSDIGTDFSLLDSNSFELVDNNNQFVVFSDINIDLLDVQIFNLEPFPFLVKPNQRNSVAKVNFYIQNTVNSAGSNRISPVTYQYSYTQLFSSSQLSISACSSTAESCDNIRITLNSNNFPSIPMIQASSNNILVCYRRCITH